MSAKEMFEKLGYETDLFWQKDYTIEYLKRKEDDFYGMIIATTITFHKRLKQIKINGTINKDDLQAINKQVEELGWK
jgi:hypothetical protein